MSGAQMRRFCWETVNAVCMAANVLMLNKSVPTDCTAAEHQSMRPGSNDQSRKARSSPASRSSGELTTWRNCR